MSRKVRKDKKGYVLRKGEIQRANGLYSFSYFDPLGKRRYIYCRDLFKLRAKENEIIKALLNGLEAYAEGNGTLNDAFDRYLAGKYNLRETTISYYKYLYDHLVRNGFGNKRLSTIRYSDVNYFYLYLLKEKKFSTQTVNSINTLLHPTFQMALRDGVIRVNPTDGVMADIKKRTSKDMRVRHALTIQQEKAFLNYIKDSAYFSQWFSLFTFLLGTGCRIGEAIGLRWKDIDLEARTISINHSVKYYAKVGDAPKKCAFHLSLPKTSSGVRTIPMLDEVYNELIAEYDKQKETGFCDYVLEGMTGFIFFNQKGMIHNPQTVNKIIKRIVDTYNKEEVLLADRENRQPLILPEFSCHHLRHTFCTRLCENETNMKVIQSVMGHSNITTTMNIYTEATEEKKKDEFIKIDAKMKLF
jgi:integrase